MVTERSAFGQLLYAMRRAAGLSQSELSRRVGTTGPNISRFEAPLDSPNYRRPSPEMVRALAAALEASPDERDELLRAAGYAPVDPLSVLEAEPEVLAAARLVLDERVSAAAKAEVRAALQGVLATVGVRP